MKLIKILSLIVSAFLFYDINASGPLKVDGNSGSFSSRVSKEIEDAKAVKDAQTAQAKEQTSWLNLQYNPVMIAVVKGNATAVEENLKQNAEKKVNARNINGKTALMLLAENPLNIPKDVQLKIGKLLLSRGADVKMLDKLRTNALMYASAQGNEEFVDLLMKAKPNIDTMDINGWTALMWSVFSDHLPVVELLLNAHADVNPRNKDKETVFEVAKKIDAKKYVPILTKAKVAQELRQNTARLQADHDAKHKEKK